MFLMDQLSLLGDKSVVITDVDMRFSLNSIAVEVFEADMVDKLKKLNGLKVLGEELIVRRINEETANITALASAVALATLK